MEEGHMYKRIKVIVDDLRTAVVIQFIILISCIQTASSIRIRNTYNILRFICCIQYHQHLAADCREFQSSQHYVLAHNRRVKGQSVHIKWNTQSTLQHMPSSHTHTP